MNSRFQAGLLASVVVAALVGSMGVVNGQPAKRGQNYAILIGVVGYESKVLRKLEYAERDVTELSRVLQTRGFPRKNIVLMTATESSKRREPRFSPRSKNILRELDLYLSLPEKGDTAIVALAGHGVQFEGDREHYFCPIDADLKNKNNLISITELYKRLEKSKASVKLLLVDACRNDPLSSNAPRSVSEKVVSKTRPLLADPPGGIGAFFSCSKGQEAYESEELGHGVFFHFVLEGLRGKAANSEKRITVGGLTAYVSRNVNRFAVRELGAKQQPDLLGRINPAVPLAVVQRDSSKRFTNSVGMEFVHIPKGTFMMGSVGIEPGRYPDERRHEVELSRPFFLGVTEVTQEQYKRVMGVNPSEFSSGGQEKATVRGLDTRKFPVDSVSWEDASKFCRTLSALAAESNTKRRYRLPTEAEWEYACRGNSKFHGTFHYGMSLSSKQANFDGSVPYGKAAKGVKRNRTVVVRSFDPNGFGLHDMHGNVFEWCADWYSKDTYTRRKRLDPKGPVSGTKRVLRGGSWSVAGADCRTAFRGSLSPEARNYNFGFRVVCEIDE